MTPIETQWQWLLASTELPPETREMILAASGRAQLRRLFPYTSLQHALKFSITTEYPYTERFPYIVLVEIVRPGDEAAYDVRDCDQRPTRVKELGAALDLLVDLLPKSN